MLMGGAYMNRSHIRFISSCVVPPTKVGSTVSLCRNVCNKEVYRNERNWHSIIVSEIAVLTDQTPNKMQAQILGSSRLNFVLKA
jgi:hypothetical protein